MNNGIVVHLDPTRPLHRLEWCQHGGNRTTGEGGSLKPSTSNPGPKPDCGLHLALSTEATNIEFISVLFFSPAVVPLPIYLQYFWLTSFTPAKQLKKALELKHSVYELLCYVYAPLKLRLDIEMGLNDTNNYCVTFSYCMP